jgi:hypothetical protein
MSKCFGFLCFCVFLSITILVTMEINTTNCSTTIQPPNNKIFQICSCLFIHIYIFRIITIANGFNTNTTHCSTTIQPPNNKIFQTNSCLFIHIYIFRIIDSCRGHLTHYLDQFLFAQSRNRT